MRSEQSEREFFWHAPYAPGAIGCVVAPLRRLNVLVSHNGHNATVPTYFSFGIGKGFTARFRLPGSQVRLEWLQAEKKIINWRGTL
jgi:hypothetical protein